jgi:hypothetical protein
MEIGDLLDVRLVGHRRCERVDEAGVGIYAASP